MSTTSSLPYGETEPPGPAVTCPPESHRILAGASHPSKQSKRTREGGKVSPVLVSQGLDQIPCRMTDSGGGARVRSAPQRPGRPPENGLP